MKTGLVTGATDGIGLATAAGLAKAGWTVLVHGRSPPKAEAACARLAGAVPGGRFVPVSGDLASLAQVRALAAQVRQQAPALDALINNAGVFMTERVLTADGLETTLAVNHFAPFLLTGLLRPALEAAGAARVVNVSSIAHTRGRLRLDDLTFARGFEGYGAYAASKLANVLFTHALARRLAGTKVTTHALHPGVIDTKLLRQGFGVQGASVESGAATSLFAATSEALEGRTGLYLQDAKVARCAAHADDQALEEGLWEASARLTAPG